MSMRAGLPYSMVNTVVEFQENRLIAWQTHAPGVLKKVIGGRIWRYELEPVEGGTLVRESWDISRESGLTKSAVRKMATVTRKNMTATLARIEQVVTG
ncbi:Dimethyladenosine transferase [Stackebrandtia soli]